MEADAHTHVTLPHTLLGNTHVLLRVWHKQDADSELCPTKSLNRGQWEKREWGGSPPVQKKKYRKKEKKKKHYFAAFTMEGFVVMCPLICFRKVTIMLTWQCGWSVPSAEFFCASGACVGVYVPVRGCVNQAAIVIPVRGEQGGVVVPRPLRTTSCAAAARWRRPGGWSLLEHRTQTGHCVCVSVKSGCRSLLLSFPASFLYVF